MNAVKDANYIRFEVNRCSASLYFGINRSYRTLRNVHLS